MLVFLQSFSFGINFHFYISDFSVLGVVFVTENSYRKVRLDKCFFRRQKEKGMGSKGVFLGKYVECFVKTS